MVLKSQQEARKAIHPNLLAMIAPQDKVQAGNRPKLASLQLPTSNATIVVIIKVKIRLRYCREVTRNKCRKWQI